MKPWSKKWLGAALSLTIALSAFAAPVAAAEQSQTSEYEVFLEEKHGLIVEATMTKEEFLQAVADLLKLEVSEETVSFTDLQPGETGYDAAAALYQHGIITSSKVAGDQPLTAYAAAYIGVKAAGLTELAYSYTPAKVEAALAKFHLNAAHFTKQAGQELAAAIDTGLIPASFHNEFKGQGIASSELIETVLGKLLEFKGNYKRYIGNTSDEDIFVKLHEAYRTADLITAPELKDLVETALKQDLFTGYNLKDSRYNSNFVDSLAITYGHDNLTHATQLIGLLRGAGLDAKVQLEPKTSAFIFLKEWGTPVQTDDYQVIQIENGNYIAYAKEYDLAFEFASAEDKAAFQDIVLQFAKKNSDDTTGLIASSWWQPLYYSLTEIADYTTITNNKITSEDSYYYAQSFSVTEQSPAIVEGLKTLDPEVQIETYEFWVNQAFHNYLTGADFK